MEFGFAWIYRRTLEEQKSIEILHMNAKRNSVIDLHSMPLCYILATLHFVTLVSVKVGKDLLQLPQGF